MRPAQYLFLALLLVAVCDGVLVRQLSCRQVEYTTDQLETRRMAGFLGLTDLAVSTEARYTRHPAVSDRLVPFMDHPGALEHFPSGSYFAPAR